MKKFVLASFLALFGLYAASQQIDSSQVKLKTNGGLGADAARALAVTVYRGTSAPASPLTGQTWCDTTTTPCAMKVYNGSTWDSVPTNTAIPMQADATSMPANPSDGQVFFSKAQRTLYVYDGTASVWYRILLSAVVTNASVVTDIPSGNVITAPSGAVTVAKRAGCGGAWSPTGTVTYKITFYNATGGETTGSPTSANVTTTAGTDCIDLSNIQTGGTGTVGRRIYRSKTTAPTGEWYWVWTIADNSTTTYTDTSRVVEGNVKLVIPQVNFSGDLTAAWTFYSNLPSTVTGGCGTTSDQKTRCKLPGGSALAGDGGWTATTGTSDTNARLYRDISAYKTGNFTIQWRWTGWGIEPPTYKTGEWGAGCRLGMWGFRDGSANGAIHFRWGNGSQSTTWNPNGGTIIRNYGYRAATGGAITVGQNVNQSWPPFTQYPPLWQKVTKRGTGYMSWMSSDGLMWAPETDGMKNCVDTVLDCGFYYSNPLWDVFEILMSNDTSCGGAYNFVLEWDSWTLTPE